MNERLRYHVTGAIERGEGVVGVSAFGQWLDKVDELIKKALNVSLHDLPDFNYRDWYDTKVKPATAAKRVVKYIKEEWS